MAVRPRLNDQTTLDLRHGGSIPPSLCPAFEEVALRCRGPFNDAVARLSAPQESKLIWWVQGPPSRNTLASPFFHNFCVIHFVRHLVDLRKFEFHEIRVDSPALKDILVRILSSAGIRGCVVRGHGNLRRISLRLKYGWIAPPFFFVRRVIQYWFVRSTRRPADAALPSRPVILIDTFVTADYATTDRWYGELWRHLSEDLKADTRFVPTIIGTPLSRYRATCVLLRNGPRGVFIKDDFLTLRDLLGAGCFRRQAMALRIPRVEVLGFDLSALVREELETSRDVPTIMESLITYRFIARLAQCGVKVRLAIDWFEGHAIDKAWNLAWHQYYPRVKRIGYRAFESFPFYLCSYPTPEERVSGVLPNVIAVQGVGTTSTVREFISDLKVVVIPSFRAQYVWEFDLARRQRTDFFSVLVALPISIDSAVRIINKLLDTDDAGSAESRPFRYVFKPHPTVSAERVTARLARTLRPNMEFTSERSFGRLLAESNLLVTEASSTCLEALACGVPVVVVLNETGLTFDPLPASIPSIMFKRVRTSADLMNAVTHFSTLPEEVIDEQRAHSANIRLEYFEPITPDGVSRLMDVDGTHGAAA